MTIDVGALIGAILAFLAAVIVALINSKAQMNKFLAALDKQNALVMYRLGEVEKKVTAHNNFDTRMVAMEERQSAFETFVKTMFAQMEEHSK